MLRLVLGRYTLGLLRLFLHGINEDFFFPSYQLNRGLCIDTVY